ncbi:MAG: DNA-3-methyladenine glycosylase, partial [Alkalispirochaeta sp.]
AGHIYVYRSYGIHWCLNVVTAATGVGEAVLIRAIEPLWGIESMCRRRGIQPPIPATGETAATGNSLDPRLTNGPGKLCQALGITGEFDGVALGDPAGPIHIERDAARAIGEDEVGVGPRVGISKNTEAPWRFFLKGNQFVGHR